MAYTVPIAGENTLIGFGTTSYSFEMTNLQIRGLSRETIDATHLAGTQYGSTDYRGAEKIPSKTVEPGTIEITGHFDPDTDIPIDQDSETTTITWPDHSGVTAAGTWAGTGHVSNVDVEGATPRGKLVINLTIEMSGVWTFTDST